MYICCFKCIYIVIYTKVNEKYVFNVTFYIKNVFNTLIIWKCTYTIFILKDTITTYTNIYYIQKHILLITKSWFVLVVTFLQILRASTMQVV